MLAPLNFVQQKKLNHRKGALVFFNLKPNPLSAVAMKSTCYWFVLGTADNLSRGNLAAVRILQELLPEPGRLQFIYADLGDAKAVDNIFSQNAFDAVMHFAAVAYVGESTLDHPKYYHNITSNTLTVLETMATHGVPTLIYSSTCATYGEPEKMPITEETPQLPINPYGKAKKMGEDIILDFHMNSNMVVMILRYFNVIGSDPNGRLGEAPRPELWEHGRISGKRNRL
ncbi:hypothetical protein K7X08_017254 [Anisodus acutangulus]|uniref:NAD-dependent epimerase/dehydratase domain-containing protein n=1 Tax=Anisodus acutangulus TaxID=402998 RepID=A0A9Q1LTE7_9SOLA|nr:hypothetical protein K7X08_017254 [Anisodus acutangulus]